MKRKFLLLMLALIAMATTARAQVVLNEMNFPDANFRAALASILGISEGDEITDEMIQRADRFELYAKSIADLKGIEHFTALEWLYCYNNQLTSLDVSKNTALTYLRCGDNQLTSLDVSKNTALTKLSCDNNQLTSLDVSKNTALTDLDCGYNQLTALDVSKNTALTELRCYGNQLTALDVSKNTALTVLYCRLNRLTALDVSKNTALKYLRCYDNQLTALDVSKNTALKYLWCYSNQIKGEAMDALVASLPTVEYSEFYVINTKDTNEGNVCTKSQVAIAKGKGWMVYDYNGGNRPYPEYEGSDPVATKLLLNAENFPDANFRAALASILGISEGNEITEEKIAATTRLEVNEKSIADLTGIEYFTALTELNCDDNLLSLLDISLNTSLTLLWCDNNQLTSLDISQNNQLTELTCNGNKLKKLDVSNNLKLERLYCNNNQLTSLDVSKNTALKTLYCHSNQLALLDVSKNIVLTKLYCFSNKLALLDVSNNVSLTHLNCQNNQLTKLDVSKNTALIWFYCTTNQLTSLNISENTALTTLNCYGNQLTDLDVSKNTALEYLSCNFNRLTSLDVSNNTRLTELYCRGNQLTSLDVSKNTALIQFWCHTNQIKGEAMDALVNSLPTVENGKFYVIDTNDENEGNVCTKSQVAVAKGKGWIVYDYNGGDSQIYDGNSNPIRRTTVDGLEWTYTIVSEEDKTCIVGGAEDNGKDVKTYPAIDVNTTGAITIPTTLDGYKVIGTARESFRDSKISSVVVPEGVTTIGNKSFMSCKNLTSVTLPEGLTWIDEEAFCESGITSITLPESLVRIGEQAFEETKLTSIFLPKNVKYLGNEDKVNEMTGEVYEEDDLYGGVFDNCELLEEVNVDEANTAYASVDGMLLTKDKKILLFCPQLNTAEAVPEGVVEINRLAFYGCKKATISLPISLKAIGEAAFRSEYLESIVIPEGVTRIEEETFEGCDNLSLITLPKGLTYIAAEAFKYCPITSINLGESLVFIGDDAFMGTKLTSVTLPKSLLVIEGDAFMNCPLETVISKIEDPFVIDDGAFGGEKSDYNNNSFETATLYVPYGTKAKYEATRYWNKFVNIVEMDLVPVDEDNNVDFGNGMDESDNLDGAVIRDIYYNIGDGNGEYNADEGCVVIKKTTDDGTVDGLSGKDIFGEDFKGQFTGIVFKVPAGKGTIKVNAETTGNMLLKVKIGDNEPVGMELNGKLKVTFPYNVSETTYVYIYAGANNEAKGFGTTNATEDAALKIYGIEFIRDETTAIDNSQLTIDNSADSWYTIDGKKLNGEPRKKGIYIYNGKKVKK